MTSANVVCVLCVFSCSEAWLAVTLQVVKLFVLSRVSLKTLSTLPGMEPLPEITLPQADDAKQTKGGKVHGVLCGHCC